MPFLPILIGLLAVGVILLAVFVLRLRGAVRRFGIVRRRLTERIGDEAGLLRARSAALGVAVSDLRQDPSGHRLAAGAPRTIELSVEREDHRA